MNLALVMTDKLETLGQRLRTLRKAKGLRQEDIANLVGVKPQTIGSIERNSTPSIKMPEIAEALGVSLQFLKTGKDSPELSLVQQNEFVKGYRVEQISEALPIAFDKALNSVRNFLLQQDKLVEGDISLIKNKDLFFNILSKAIIYEITGDFMASGIQIDNINTTSNKD